MLFPHKLRAVARLVMVPLLLSLTPVDLALAITAEQQQMLQNLSPAQRAALAAQYGGGAQATTRSIPLSAPTGTVATVPTEGELEVARDKRRASDGRMRVLGGDTLLLDVVQKADVFQETPDSILRLMGKSIHQLDKNGVFHIEGLPGIPLLGLNVDEINARLSAEPAFRGFAIGVQILPVEPYDVGALKPFGYDFFNGAAHVSLAADMPIPSNYPIGPGDVVNVQLFGKETANYSLQVNRDGMLDFPELGPIGVAGLTYGQLKSKIQGRVGSQMIGITPNVTMGQLRSIQIFIAGEVNRPGTYTVSALSTVTNAILTSGGVKETGSLRKVQVKRSGKTVSTLDLYDLLLSGDSGKDITLQLGDVIFIPPVGTTVSVVGEVKRPAIYELKDETTAAQLVALAGGGLPTSFPSRTKLERLNERGERTVIDLDLKNQAAAATNLQNGDVIRIPSALEESADIVSLEGHFYRPGIYQWRAGMRVSDVVGSIDQLRPRPDMEYALILREEGPERTPRVLDIHPAQLFAAPKSVADPLLHPRDKLYFFGLTESRKDTLTPVITLLQQQASANNPERTVAITGQVRHAGQYPLTDNMRVSDLLRAAGTLNQSAYELEAELIRRVVRNDQRLVERTVVNLAALSSSDAANPLLQPFDSLDIRQIPLWREKEEVQLFGEVRFPGKYTIRQGETLRDVIVRAGGLTNLAYPRGAVFTREELRKKEQENIDQLKVRLRQDVAAISLEQAQNSPERAQSIAMSNSLLAQLETAKAAGRLVIDLPTIVRDDSDIDIVLKDGDKLYIPKRPEEVTVIGEVNYATSHFWDDSLSRDEYIDRSGGLTYKADEDRIYVVRANGEVAATKARWWWFNGKPHVETGDVIVVPLDAERIRPLTLWTNVSQIFYQIGVAAAAWKTIGVF